MTAEHRKLCPKKFDASETFLETFGYDFYCEQENCAGYDIKSGCYLIGKKFE